MGLKEEVLEMKKEVQAVREQSMAMEFVKYFKKQNKRLFIIILVILTMWFATISYLVYILNDVGYEEVTEETTTSQEIHDIDNIDDSYIINGDNYGNN